MENGQFAEGYQDSANHYRFSNESTEIQELMEGPRKWASYFDRQLTLFLKDAPGDAPSAIFKELDTYKNEWANRYLDGKVKENRELAYHDIDAQPSVSELNFHVINKAFMPAWHRLLLPEKQPPLAANQIETIQTKLAVQAANLAQFRVDIAEREQMDDVQTGLTPYINEQLSKTDIGILLLEIQKDDSFEDEPHLLVIPAPPQFEFAHKNHTLSAHFIIIDTELQVSRGIRAHSLAHNPGVDKKFVTLLDSEFNLGISQPGNIALSYLRTELSIKKASRNPAFQGDINSLLRAANTARKVLGNDVSDIMSIKRNIQGKIIEDLYTN